MLDALYNTYVSTVLNVKDDELYVQLPTISDALRQFAASQGTLQGAGHNSLLHRIEQCLQSSTSTAVQQFTCISLLYTLSARCTYTQYASEYSVWCKHLLHCNRQHRSASICTAVQALYCLYSVLQRGCAYAELRRDIHSTIAAKCVLHILDTITDVHSSNTTAAQKHIARLLMVLHTSLQLLGSSVRNTVSAMHTVCIPLLSSDHESIREVRVYFVYMFM